MERRRGTSRSGTERSYRLQPEPWAGPGWGPGAKPLANFEKAKIHVYSMPIKIITIPVNDPTAGESEFNQFVKSHRVVAVDRRFVDEGPSSFWTVWIDYFESVANGHESPYRGQRGKGIDYKEILSREEFPVYSLLRELRKELAKAEGVPIYAIFHNEQLAKMVQSRVRTLEELGKIEGIGEARVRKYGSRVLAVLLKGWNSHAASEQPDQPDSGV